MSDKNARLQLPLGGYILGGRRWLVHPHAERGRDGRPVERLGHLLHWPECDVAQPGDVFLGVCGQRYRFTGWSPSHSAPSFVDDTEARQIASTVIRRQVAIDHLCPRCYRELTGYLRGGLLRRNDWEGYNPRTRERYSRWPGT